jgi:hypothetical protein
MPKPAPDEERDEFLDRCMDDGTMRRDFPERDQRRAVCNKQWRKGQRQNGDG